MKIKKILFTLVCFAVLMSASAFADNIRVALSVESSGSRRFVVTIAKGGIGTTGSLTNKSVFVMENQAGSEIQSGGQVRFRFGDSVWYLRDGRISRISPRSTTEELTTFELEADGDFYRLMAPGGGWVGPVSKDGRSLSIVEERDRALVLDIIVNPEVK